MTPRPARPMPNVARTFQLVNRLILQGKLDRAQALLEATKKRQNAWLQYLKDTREKLPVDRL